MTHPIAARLTPPDYEHVPTVEELAREGLARQVTGKHVSRRTGKVSTDTWWTLGGERGDDARSAPRAEARADRAAVPARAGERGAQMCYWCDWGRLDVACQNKTDPHLAEAWIEQPEVSDADGRL